MAYSYKNTYRKEEELAKSKKVGFWGFYKPPIKPYNSLVLCFLTGLCNFWCVNTCKAHLQTDTITINNI
jgi:hypothetical protein